MDKAQVMKLVKRGPHKTSCWAWRGPLWGGLPTTRKGELIDPGKILGAESSIRVCRSKLCVNPAHRDGAQEKPLLPPPDKRRPKPNTKARTLKLKTLLDQERCPTPPTKAKEAKPIPKPEPKPKKPVRAKQKPRKSTKKKEKTHCNNGHPWIAENIWTSPTSGVSKCRVCERERKARAKAKKKAAKK